jgi:hypothetical protein
MKAYNAARDSNGSPSVPNAYDLKKVTLVTCATLISVAVIGSELVARDTPTQTSDGPANAATKSVHDEAERILGTIQLTAYKHDTDIDEKKGQFYCDCSGFVGYVLNRTVSKDGKKGPFGNGRRRPLAADYERGFEKAPQRPTSGARWQQIARVCDARPGDVIAWRHEVPKPGNTGHVVIVDKKPVVEKDGLVRMDIIDSTTLPSADITGDKGKTGIGRRTMWFKVDSDGRAVAYVRGKRTATPKTEAISIGRACSTNAATSEERPAGRRAA